jgi:O-antigen ligase
LFETYYYFKTNKDYIFNANLYNKEFSSNLTSEKRSSNLNRVLDLKNTASSGRKQLWKNSLLLIKEKKIILGYGPKADRFLLTEFYARYENTKYYIDSYGNNFLVESNVSNALIYAYLSGGFLGFLLLLTINIIASLTILKNIFIEKIFLGKDAIKLFSTTLLIFLGVRGVFENSYSVFGIDYIFFILSYMLAQKK